MQGGNMVLLVQLTMLFTGTACLILAGSLFASMGRSPEGKKPFALFLLVECLIFVCAAMFLWAHFRMAGGFSKYLVPAAGLTLALNLPVLASVWIAQKSAKAKR
jgi:hypothetical protein